MIFRNLNETKVSMTGDSPHLRILAQLIPTKEKEENRVRLYTSLDMMESLYNREERSIGLSETKQKLM